MERIKVKGYICQYCKLVKPIAKALIQSFKPPAQVVWPDKNDETDFPTLEEDSPELNKMIGWNACLDEFKRLNPDVGK